MQRCGHETVGQRQVCGSDTQENSIEVVCKIVQNEEARSLSTTGNRHLNFVKPDAKVAIALKKVLIDTNFNRNVLLEHQKAKKANRFYEDGKSHA